MPENNQNDPKRNQGPKKDDRMDEGQQPVRRPGQQGDESHIKPGKGIDRDEDKNLDSDNEVTGRQPRQGQ